MAITGLHGLLYTSEPNKLRALLRDAFGFNSVDAGGGWLIFAMPPAELGVHPDEGPTFESGVRHQMAFMCDNIGKTIAELRGKGVTVVGDPTDEGYGITTMLHLPGGCEVMLYEPRHPIAAGMTTKRSLAKPKAVTKAKSAATKKTSKEGTSRRRGRRAGKAGRGR
jgi:hypothetical protein